MIFVTVGTSKFDDLVKAVDSLAKDMKEDFTVQIGKGEYIPRNCKWFRFETPLSKYFKRSRLVITHGGAGTLFECLNLDVKVIAISNPKAKGEHQSDLIDELDKENYIIVSDLNQLRRAIRETKKLKKYIVPKCEIGEKIIEFLK